MSITIGIMAIAIALLLGALGILLVLLNDRVEGCEILVDKLLDAQRTIDDLEAARKEHFAYEAKERRKQLEYIGFLEAKVVELSSKQRSETGDKQ